MLDVDGQRVVWIESQSFRTCDDMAMEFVINESLLRVVKSNRPEGVDRRQTVRAEVNDVPICTCKPFPVPIHSCVKANHIFGHGAGNSFSRRRSALEIVGVVVSGMNMSRPIISSF